MLPHYNKYVGLNVWSVGLSPQSIKIPVQLDSSDEDVAVVNERPIQTRSRNPLTNAGQGSGPPAGNDSWHLFHALRGVPGPKGFTAVQMSVGFAPNNAHHSRSGGVVEEG